MKKLFNWLFGLNEGKYPIKESTSYPFIYPKNPKYNGNYCAGEDGVNIYDHLNNKGEIDWQTVDAARHAVQEWHTRKWIREHFWDD